MIILVGVDTLVPGKKKKKDKLVLALMTIHQVSLVSVRYIIALRLPMCHIKCHYNTHYDTYISPDNQKGAKQKCRKVDCAGRKEQPQERINAL